MLARAELSPNDLAWTDGMAEWLEIGKISQLASPPPSQTIPPAGKLVPPAGSISSGSAVPTSAASPYQTPVSGHAYAPGSTIYQPRPVQSTNSLAITSLVLGCLSLVACGFLSSIPGAICGHIALSQIKRSSPEQPGRGLAITGLVLNHIVNALLLLVILFFLGMMVLGLSLSASDFENLNIDDSDSIEDFLDSESERLIDEGEAN